MIPEQDYASLKSIVLSLELPKDETKETSDVVTYRDNEYFIDMCSPIGPAGEFFASTHYSGADIYVWKEVPLNLRRVVIIHELLEADLLLIQGANRSEAHSLAVAVERRFARETLDDRLFGQYTDFRNSNNHDKKFEEVSK